MKKPMQNRPAQTACQLERMRSLYSQIGEPLPVDIMMELYRHLDRALRLDEGERERRKGKNGVRGRKSNIC